LFTSYPIPASPERGSDSIEDEFYVVAM